MKMPLISMDIKLALGRQTIEEDKTFDQYAWD